MDKAIKEYQFFQKLIELPFVESIILYGSRARGEARERADIDMAIDCPLATQEDWQQVLQIIDDADTLLKIDCVNLSSLPSLSPLRASIGEDGVVLFKRKYS